MIILINSNNKILFLCFFKIVLYIKSVMLIMSKIVIKKLSIGFIINFDIFVKYISVVCVIIKILLNFNKFGVIILFCVSVWNIVVDNEISIVVIKRVIIWIDFFWKMVSIVFKNNGVLFGLFKLKIMILYWEII